MQTLPDAAVKKRPLWLLSLNPNCKYVSKLFLNKFHKTHRNSEEPVIPRDNSLHSLPGERASSWNETRLQTLLGSRLNLAPCPFSVITRV